MLKVGKCYLKVKVRLDVSEGPRLEKGTKRSKVVKWYLKVQSWQSYLKVQGIQRLPSGAYPDAWVPPGLCHLRKVSNLGLATCSLACLSSLGQAIAPLPALLRWSAAEAATYS